MSYKIVFFDIDGTLIDYKTGCISTSTRNAIRKLNEQGIRIVAATGRPLSMCKDLEMLGIDTFITANGAYVKYQNEVIYKSVLDNLVVTEIKQFAEQNGQALSFFTESLSMNGIQNSETLQALQQTLSLKQYPKIDEHIIEKEIYLMCLYGDQHTIERYKHKFTNLTFQQWHPYIANVLQNEVSKSIAAKAVLQYFEYTPNEAVAFGDGENDIDLLQLAGCGIAMGNGNEKLKKIADFVTKNCDEDGIEYALKRLQFI